MQNSKKSQTKLNNIEDQLYIIRKIRTAFRHVLDEADDLIDASGVDLIAGFSGELKNLRTVVNRLTSDLEFFIKEKKGEENER